MKYKYLDSDSQVYINEMFYLNELNSKNIIT